MLWAKKFRTMLAAVCLLAACGCDPTGPGAADEEKEPQFLIGRSRVNTLDFGGAIEAFENALEMNPHSGAAHFELGWLYAEKASDPAAAIYHYQKFLKLRPTADNAETIQQQIVRLKAELAKAAVPIAPSSALQRQLEQLTQEKRDLQAEVDRLRTAAVQNSPTNRPPLLGSQPRNNPPSGATTPARTATAQTARPPRPAAAGRFHRVQAGETPTIIARRYNVKLETLLAMNPSLNPRRMLVGQNVALPAQ